MTCACEQPQASANPRRSGECVQCCRRLPAGWRDSAFERDFLEAAEREAQSMGLGYANMVQDRLTAAERTYGVASYLEKGLRGLLSEVDEEALDVGGWGTLAALVADGTVVDADLRVLVVVKLQEAAALGARIHAIMTELQRSVGWR